MAKVGRKRGIIQSKETTVYQKWLGSQRKLHWASEEKNIANAFADYFEGIYDGHNSPEHLALEDNFIESFSKYHSDHIQESINPYFVTWSEMLDIASKIKARKSTTDLLRPEHFLLGSGELLCHLHLLFNSMLQHSYVPHDFLVGSLSPIVKDAQGDISSTANYRGITPSCLPAKLFEFLIQKKISHLLGTDDWVTTFNSA